MTTTDSDATPMNHEQMTTTDESRAFHCGLVAVLGRPNVGKSTLMNQMVGFKLSAVTSKPQTTRNRIMGVVTKEAGQIVFVDTPGVHRARRALNRYLIDQALDVIDDIDVAVLMVTARDRPDHADLNLIMERLDQAGVVPMLVINKIDRVKRHTDLLPIMEAWSKAARFETIIPVSALKDKGLDRLESAILDTLPEGPALFPDDMLTDRPEQWLAAELIREQVMARLEQELPYSIAVRVTKFQDRPDQQDVVMEATIFVERESQKPIVVGRGGKTIKDVGVAARKEITAMLGRPVHLKLWVKVERDWTRDPRGLKKMGYI
ncbi:MAG: GTPase Era [Deltaproteobacteria bacterium]|nr:GTPase Era [Deltaproteobacteria bacterium]